MKIAIHALLAAGLVTGTLAVPVTAQSYRDDRDRDADQQMSRTNEAERSFLIRNPSEEARGEDRSREREDRERQRDDRSASRQDRRQAATHYAAGYYAGYLDALDDYAVLVVDVQRLRGAQRQASRDQRDGGQSEQDTIRQRLREQLRSEGRRRLSARSESQSQSQRMQLTGEVLRTRRVSLRSSDGQHMVALVETDSGRRRLVDLGRPENLEDFQVAEGAQLEARGRMARTRNNIPVLLADRVRVDGNSQRINRDDRASDRPSRSDQQDQQLLDRREDRRDEADRSWFESRGE